MTLKITATDTLVKNLNIRISRRFASVITLPDFPLIVTGGEDSSSKILSSFEVLDKNKKWEILDDEPPVNLSLIKPLDQACQTQNTARASKGVFMPKKLSEGRS